MSTGEGGRPGNGQEPSQEQEKRRTPPPRRRTPPPRTSRGASGEVEHVATGARAVDQAKLSVWNRMFGRQGLDRALEERFNPYNYESTRPALRWLFLALILFICAGAFALYADFQFRNTLRDWQADGIIGIPPSSDDVGRALFAAGIQAGNPDENVCNDDERESESLLGRGCESMDILFEYASSVGMECATPEDLATVISEDSGTSPGCERLVDVARDYNGLYDRGNIATYLILLAFVVVAFPFSTFTHRSSRNLRTMKSEGQKHSPDGAVTRFFIPVLNLYKPLVIFVELFRGSDPRVPEGDTEAWKKKGGVSPIAVIWGLLWPAMLVFNPVFVSRFWFGGREDLGDAERTVSALLVSDIIIICLGVAAILMANTLSAWQDARAARYGTVTVTPPRPKDPLEKALEEGIRRSGNTPRKR